jgi:hypothetical protein
VNADRSDQHTGAAGGSTARHLRQTVAVAVLSQAAGLLSGACVAWVAIVWSMNGLHDLLNVPALSAVPIRDRGPGVPGPSAAYWLAWATPLVAVYGVGGLLFWRWPSGRLCVGSFLVAHLAVSLVIIPFLISMDLGGFAPN